MKIITSFTENEKIPDIGARQKHPAGPAGCQSINYFNRCLLLVFAGPRMSANNGGKQHYPPWASCLRCWQPNSAPERILSYLTYPHGGWGVKVGGERRGGGTHQHCTSVSKGDLSQKMLNQKKKKRNDPGCFRVPDKMGFMKKRPSVRS